MLRLLIKPLQLLKRLKRWLVIATTGFSMALLLSACQVAPKGPSPVAPAPVAPAPAPAPAAGVVGPISAERGSPRQSAATTPRLYRESGASHLYGLNKDRIYKGRLPPMLYAIGVLNVEIDRAGRVTKLDWQRAPSHAPEVIKEIEAIVRSASPFPAPVRMGRVVYTDVWLWHKSGRFQLDTLTEGQD